MMHDRPRSLARSAYPNMASGILCAERTFASNGMPNASSWAQAWRITSQSLWLPITTPTTGLASERESSTN